jgi:hypothetical protein
MNPDGQNEGQGNAGEPEPEAPRPDEGSEGWPERDRRKGFDRGSPSERRSSNGRRRSAR